jgi:Transposase DDE domain
LYKFLPKRLPNFFRYVNKVYGFSEILNSMEDKRPDAELTPQIIFLSVFICCLLRFGSLNRLEFEAKNKRLSKFLKANNVDKDTFCANSIANGLENIDTDILERQLISIPKKMKRNKVFCKSIGGMKIASLDGTEIYRSEKIHCDECLEYHIKTKEGTKTDYVHKIVLMQMVGRMDLSFIQTILGMEKILPKDARGDTSEEGHEGEITVARRLILRMIEAYGNIFFDVLTTDGLHTNAPFIRFLYSLGKYLVSRVKNERTDLYKEIESLSELVSPLVINDWEEQVEVWIYEIPGLSEWLADDIPIRSFKIIEKSYKVVSGERVYTKEDVFRCVTTIPEEKADGNVIRQIVHAKWGIENNGFKELKDNWYLTHNYHHHPNAIYAMLLILFIAYNLFYSYIYRHVKAYRLYGLTMKQIIEEMICSFISQKWRMSWVTFDG